MKKALIALMALASVAAATTITEDTTIIAPTKLNAGAFDFSFTLTASTVISGDYDLLLAYYQVNNGGAYDVNAFKLSSTRVLTLERGKNLTLSDDALTSDSTMGTNNTSTFAAIGGTDAYTLSAPGTYTVDYLGGTNGDAAADLYLDGVKVAAFNWGSHAMNGAAGGDLTLNVKVNGDYVAAPTIPEPTTATLSLLALAGMAARRRRRK